MSGGSLEMRGMRTKICFDIHELYSLGKKLSSNYREKESKNVCKEGETDCFEQL